MADVRRIAQLKQNIPISIKGLVGIFDWPRSLLKLTLENRLHPAGNRGKHTVVGRDHERQIPD
jgi:hypothetical protein